MVITVVLLVVSVIIAVWSAPGPNTAVTAEAMGIEASREDSTNGLAGFSPVERLGFRAAR
jgi:hypothetical protein